MSGSASVELRLDGGRRVRRPMSVGAQMELYVACLHAGAPGFVEVAAARRIDGRLAFDDRHDRAGFLRSGDRAAVRGRGLALAASGREVFITPAALSAPRPGDGAVDELRVAWVDLDDPEAVARLRTFAHRPHLLVASGGTGGAHAYWRLSFPLPAQAGRAANRTLAHALGGDVVASNPGRLLRLPGTLNRKGSRPGACRVLFADLGRAPYDPARLLAGLADPEPPSSHEQSEQLKDDPLAALSACEYWPTLAGRAVGYGGRVRCPRPDHPDRHPSAKAYGEPGAGWYCFACGAGGSAIDLVSALRGGPTGRELRGEEYRRCRAETLERLGLEGADGRGRRPRGRAAERGEKTDHIHHAREVLR